MKPLLIIITFGLFSVADGQSYPALEKVLTKQFPESSSKDGRWVFYSEGADIIKIDKPLVKAIIPNFDFYQVTLTNFLGYHINQGTCVVLFDSVKSKIQLVEPLWYGGTSEEFIKLFLNKKFSDQTTLLAFLNELNDLMQVGSGYKYRTTSYNDTLITFDLGYFKGDSYTTSGNGTSSIITYTQDGVWRKIMLNIKDLAIIRYTETNPKTNDTTTIE